jgi:alkaline phosphatase
MMLCVLSSRRWRVLLAAVSLVVALPGPHPARADHVKELQTQAIATGRADWGHWGADPTKYAGYSSHSNRLVPVYVYGATLENVAGERSLYRDAARLEALYGQVPDGTLDPAAEHFDQTDVFRLQQAAAAAGKRHIFLVVFDGLDWQTLWAAAIHAAGCVPYREGAGSGLHLQDYLARCPAATGFGYCVTSPHNLGTAADVNGQLVLNPGGLLRGGYDASRGGAAPWAASDPLYLMGLATDRWHAVTDSAASATSLCAGIKTYNDAINVDPQGQPVETIAQALQKQGYAVGVVTSVPISHATPACAYAHNVHRDDYQDLTRDLLGLRSVAHRETPLPGVDVLIGCGWGEERAADDAQGTNYVPGNRYLAAEDLAAGDAATGGPYRVAQRTAGRSGREVLQEAATAAAEAGDRLLGYFGTGGGHLPFRTADGQYDPAPGKGAAATYTPEDLTENPTLAEMTAAALRVLERDETGSWLMVEAGDVDWANHDNNIDNAIGAVLSGDDAVRTITDWIDARGAWEESLVIVTADHGHLLYLDRPEALVPATSPAPASGRR